MRPERRGLPADSRTSILLRRLFSAGSRFLLTWIALPNLPFLIFLIHGGPDRSFFIVLYAIIGLAFQTSGRLYIYFLLFLVAAVMDVGFTISTLFNFSILDIAYSVKYLTTLDLLQSLTYAVAMLLMACAYTVVFLMMRSTRGKRSWSGVAAGGVCAALLATTSWTLNYDEAYDWTPPERHTGAVAAATGFTGILGAVEDRRNVMMVMVESLGALKDRALWDRIVSPLHSKTLAARYEISTGYVPFLGHTTNAEMREFCLTRQFYRNFLDAVGNDCLPAQFSRAGYETYALHGFTGEMFDRWQWYPNIGFRHMMFRTDLANQVTEMCPGVFAGVCDVDLVRIGGKVLETDPQQPKFVYALTVSTHLPILAVSPNNRYDCAAAARIEPPMLCNMAEIWGDILVQIRELATDPNLPATDFLIVGDHAAPFYHRDATRQFIPGQVPWIHIRAKPAAQI